MIGLVLAAVVAAPATAAPRIAEPMPNLYSQPANCGEIVEHEVARQKTALKGREAGPQYAVLRTIDGCAVPTPVGYHPSYVLPGAADPSRPEDERSRKR